MNFENQLLLKNRGFLLKKWLLTCTKAAGKSIRIAVTLPEIHPEKL